MNILKIENKSKYIKIVLFVLIIVPLTILITVAEIICVEAARIIMESKIKKVILENISDVKKLYFTNN
tara:strand:+ start:549 stop:752 length:204 start_codon:yes stop_codon:yes gene_type:complete